MLHEHRTHSLAAFGGSALDLVERICGMSWVLCAAFTWRDLILLNDSTSEDALLEFTVARLVDGEAFMVDSITFGFLRTPEQRERIAEYLEGLNSGDNAGHRGRKLRLRTHRLDETCAHCA